MSKCLPYKFVPNPVFLDHRGFVQITNVALTGVVLKSLKDDKILVEGVDFINDRSDPQLTVLRFHLDAGTIYKAGDKFLIEDFDDDYIVNPKPRGY